MSSIPGKIFLSELTIAEKMEYDNIVNETNTVGSWLRRISAEVDSQIAEHRDHEARVTRLTRDIEIANLEADLSQARARLR